MYDTLWKRHEFSGMDAWSISRIPGGFYKQKTGGIPNDHRIDVQSKGNGKTILTHTKAVQNVLKSFLHDNVNSSILSFPTWQCTRSYFQDPKHQQCNPANATPTKNLIFPPPIPMFHPLLLPPLLLPLRLLPLLLTKPLRHTNSLNLPLPTPRLSPLLHTLPNPQQRF